MPFHPHHTIRKNAWAFSSSELLTSILILIFFVLSLGALFADRPGSLECFSQAAVSTLVWVGWLYYVAVRRPPPFGFLGLVRGLSPWLGLVLCYGLMKVLVPVLHPQLFDAALQQLDLKLMGKGHSLWEKGLMGHPFLTDLLCLCYLGLFVWLVGLLAFHSTLRRALYQRFMLGLILVYIGGFTGYLLYPAIGPRFAYPEDWTWLSGGIIYQWSQVLIVNLGSKFDVFPSLHGAISAYLLLWQAAHDRRSLLWGLPLTIAIWISTLFLGFHYLPDLLSGGILAALAAWGAPQLEVAVGALRRALEPPRVWLLNLTEGHGDHYGKLAGRLSDLLPLGGQTAPGFVCGHQPRARAEEVIRQGLLDVGPGPYWLRPSDASGSKKNTLLALKPLSREQVIRTIFGSKRYFIVQKAMKVSALGVCRSFPPQGFKLTDVEIRMTSLPSGDVLEMRLTPQKNLFRGFLETPWNYFPSSFPLKGFELFDVVQLTRKLALRWGLFTEVEWILSEGQVYVLDGRPVREKS